MRFGVGKFRSFSTRYLSCCFARFLERCSFPLQDSNESQRLPISRKHYVITSEMKRLPTANRKYYANTAIAMYAQWYPSIEIGRVAITAVKSMKKTKIPSTREIRRCCLCCGCCARALLFYLSMMLSIDLNNC